MARDTKLEKNNGACLFRCAELHPRGLAARTVHLHFRLLQNELPSALLYRFSTFCPSSFGRGKGHEQAAVTCPPSLLSADCSPPLLHIQPAPFFASPLHCTDSAFTLCSFSSLTLLTKAVLPWRPTPQQFLCTATFAQNDQTSAMFHICSRTLPAKAICPTTTR
jgi:hypothetical protein